ncbi:MAG: peptide ABC transporter substrate-binding protein [Actinomycetia bacterium]|nr:peptide ABC transporter substrate-binding protein [Actinomycetes bacterium]
MAALLSLALAALCTSSSAAGAALRVGTTIEPNALNPFVSGNRTARAISSLIYDRLVLRDADLLTQPGLAHTWGRNESGRRWTFRLRDGLRWSDGQPVTASDVAFTLTAVMRAPENPYTRTLVNIRSVDPSGATQLIVTLTAPSQEPPVLDVPIVPQHVWGNLTGAEFQTFENDPPVGSGRYRLVPGASDGATRLEANPDHWSGPASLDMIEIHRYRDEATMVDALLQGKIDIADGLSPPAFESATRSPVIAGHTAAAETFISLGMNSGAPRGNGNVILRDVRVRQAIAFALDRDRLRREALGEQGITGTTIVPPVSPFHAEVSADELIGFDPERSASLLDRAGLRDLDGDGQLERSGGQPVELRLYTRAALPETEQLGELIVSSLEAIGIGANAAALPDSELSLRIERGDYDLFIWGWTAEPDPAFILSVLTCDEMRQGGLGDTYFCDPTYERLYNEQREAQTPSERREIFRDLQLRAYRQAPYVVLYYRPDFQAYRSDRFQIAPAGLETGLIMTGDPVLPLGLERIGGAATSGGGTTSPQPAETTEVRDEPADPIVSRSLALTAALAVAALAVAFLMLVLRLRSRRQSAQEVEEDDPQSQLRPTRRGGR